MTLVETGMDFGNFNISVFKGFPSIVINTPSYMIKFMNVMNELELTNDKIRSLYTIHENLLTNYDSDNPELICMLSRDIFTYYKLGKEIIHDLRCSAEVMLMFTSLITGERKIDSFKNVLR